MVDITGVIYETGVANPSRSHFLLLFFVCANLCCLSICFFILGINQFLLQVMGHK